MPDTTPPYPLSPTTPTPRPGTQHFTRAMVRRARLEHIATELLRVSAALRLPVPIETIYTHPPLDLWRTPASPLPPGVAARAGLAQVRWETARAVAGLVSASRWPLRIQLLGDRPLSDAEIDLFTAALLLPTALLAGINERQRSTPAAVATLFQTPPAITALRLAELGYLPPAARAPAQNDTTT